MTPDYTLIDPSGRCYITATDRQALNTMLVSGKTEACTQRKRYGIRPESGELAKAVATLTASADGTLSFVLPSERAACGRMLDTIRKQQDLGKTCYCLLVMDRNNPRNLYRQLFFN